MKNTFPRILQLGVVLLTGWLLTSCYYDPNYYGGQHQGGGNYGGGYQQGNNSQAYNTGKNYGRQDASRGLSRQASRHWYNVANGSRQTFANGYNAGYQQSQGGGGQNPGQAAYSQGLNYGRSDAQQGLRRQASRHWNTVQPAYRQSFANGYNAGFARP